MPGNQEALRIDMSPNAASRDYLSSSKPRMHSFEAVSWISCSRFKHCAKHASPCRLAPARLSTSLFHSPTPSDADRRPIPRNGPPFAGIRRPSSRTLPQLGENRGTSLDYFASLMRDLVLGPRLLTRTTQVDADSSTRSKYGARVELCTSSFSEPLASTLNDGSVGFSTRRDDPSNREFSSIDNDR